MDRFRPSGPANLKRFETCDWFGLDFNNFIDACRSRSFFQSAAQSRELFAAAHSQDLDAAIGIVAHPPGNLQDVRFALNEPAKSDPLYTSAHDKTAG